LPIFSTEPLIARSLMMTTNDRSCTDPSFTKVPNLDRPARQRSDSRSHFINDFRRDSILSA
jgi:hypothetical protein